MSTFWSIWISVITLGSIAGFYWLLVSTRKAQRPEGAEGEVPTTGHTYDGIEEYDNPMPKWWYNKFIITIVFGLIYFVLYPGLGNWQGVLGWTQEKAWEKEVTQAEEEFSALYASYAATPIESLISDTHALRSGQRIFANNCAVCHGSTATGSYGFPNLTDDDWLFGGAPKAIKTTILDGRQGAMPPWGPVLGEQGVSEVAEYVMSLSGREVNEALAEAGKAHFDTVCAACHGKDGTGIQAVGAPNLSDTTWLYGGSPELIKHSIRSGRNGVMPAHRALVGDDKVHLVAAYVYSLSHKN